MNRIEHLSWINIDVSNDYMADLTHDFNHIHLNTSSFTFDTVPANILRALYNHLEDYPCFEVVLQKFRSCSFYDCLQIPFSDRIEVSRITNPDSLSLFFEIADTNELLIYDCPGLDDASMGILGRFHFQQRTPLPKMWSLEIRDCSNFSVCALKEFIEFRKSCLLENDDNDWETQANEIICLSLLGSCPPLSEEEKEWFENNVDKFKYENLI